MDYQRVLVFGAHPDDELKMAGTIARMVAGGTEVYIAILTDGCEGYPRPEWADKIVQMRKVEQKVCDQALGTTERYNYDAPDQGLTDDKPTLLWCIGIIRKVRPDAVFNHGPVDVHRDHRRTHKIVREAIFHAGQPVNANLGPPHQIPHVYYYKAVVAPLPKITIDVTDFCWKSSEGRMAQTSQHTLWKKTKEDFLTEIERLKRERPRTVETFWIAEQTEMTDFIPLVTEE